MMGEYMSVTKKVIFTCILKIQVAKMSPEKLSPPAKDILPLLIMNTKHLNLMKKKKKLFGMAAMLEING